MEEEESILPCIIMPNSTFKNVANLILAVLLLYTATYMPYKTCFIDDATLVSEIVDWGVDALFMMDIVINFMSAVEKADGSYIHKPREIAREYVRTWFFFDLVSVMPFQLLEGVFIDEDASASGGGSGSSVANYNQLIRLMRLPRLYRMAKIVRLFKFVKLAKKSKFIQRIARALKMNAAILRMIQGMVTAVGVTHIFACFWFLTAKFQDLGPGTWVYRLDIHNSSPGVQYMWSLHWAA